MPAGGTVVAVLGRSPVLGQVKQRLAASVGEAAALAVYEWLLSRTLRAAAATGFPVYFYATEPDHVRVRDLASQYGCSLRPQQGGDLGRRMEAVFAELHREAGRVLLVGTDCPVMTPPLLWQLAGAVNGGLALVPATDGGYVAIASSQPDCWATPGRLDGVAWGSATALKDTLARLRLYEEKVTMLESRWDLDTRTDLLRAVREGLCPVPVSDLVGKEQG